MNGWFSGMTLRGAVDNALREIVDEARHNQGGREFTDQLLVSRVGKIVLDRLDMNPGTTERG